MVRLSSIEKWLSVGTRLAREGDFKNTIADKPCAFTLRL